jgi:alanine racemase
VVGVWSHLAAADDPGHPSIADPKAIFAQAVTVADAVGLQPRWRHLANSAALLTDPGTHYDLVRPGLACYGLTPVPQLGGPQQFGLVPAMTVSAPLTLVKQVSAGQGISYGYTYHAPRDTTLGLRGRQSPARRQRYAGAGRRSPGAGGGSNLHGPVRRRPRPAGAGGAR